MPAPLSLDLRRRIVAAAATRSQAAVAAQFAVGRATVQRLLYLARNGDFAPKRHNGGRRVTVTTAGQRLVAQWLHDNPSLTQAQIAARLAEAGFTVSRHTAGRTLARMGYTRKKRA